MHSKNIINSLKNKNCLINIILFLLLPFATNLVLESLGNRELFGGVKKMISDPYIFLCNTLIVMATFSVGALLKRFRYCWVGAVCFVWIGLGIINYILINNRVLPLTPYDIQLIDTLPLIIKRYLDPLPLALICFGIVISLIGIVIMFFRTLSAPKVKGSFVTPVIFFFVIIALAFGNVKLAISMEILDVRYPELAKCYVKNGFAYSFLINMTDNQVDRVDGYSDKLMASITEKFKTTDENKVDTPNVIFVQLESFFDLNTIKDVKFSQNPIPNFKKLSEENPSGLLTVPVIGAGTVNTEFEIVTGMRTADFGAGEYPYKTILVDNTCESLAYNLKSHGYTSHFIHNYTGGFYGRNNVYSNLGYDNFYSIEYMSGYERNENGWAKDEILLRYIRESLDNTEGVDLINTVSVQAHGGYIIEGDYNKEITVTECVNPEKRSSYEYYANQIYEMDKFVGELVKMLSEREEESILVVYGDHLPSLDFDENSLNGRSIYETDYFIWNNSGKEYKNENLYAYQLASTVLESVNISDGVINSCHQTYKDTDAYLFNLQALEYDVLYGEKYVYGKKNCYNASNMNVNRRQMKIESISLKEGTNNIYVIKGTGFSEKSAVRVGYSVAITEYVDEETLEFKCNELDPKIPISVWERDIGETNKSFVK